jgi:predicted DNA binding CopG/RHH family protein
MMDKAKEIAKVDGKKLLLTVRVSGELMERAQRYAAAQGTTVSELTREYLERLTSETT